MHPFLVRPQRLAAYLAAWLPVAALLVGLLRLAGGLSWAEALALAVPLSLVYAFLCLAAWYPCRALPLRPAGLAGAATTHLATAVVSAAVWAGMAWELGRLLEGAPGMAGVAGRVAGQVELLFALGVLLYLLAVAAHYLAAAFAASVEAERRALQAELARREAELAALKARLHPHFLFNALNSIAALAGAEPRAARQMCLELAELLRGFLNVGARRLHPLAEELAAARRFLNLERARFGARLQVVEEVDPACLDCPVPPLLLQPLVENAVKHGVGRLVEGGVVRIAASRAGERLCLRVENPVEEDAPPAAGAGVGLDSVRRRLAAEYGGEAVLRAGAEGATFRVEVELPAVPGGHDGVSR